MTIKATDADEPGNVNSLIRYEIIKQEPPGNMFTINSKGEVLVNNENLDREVSHHTLVHNQSVPINLFK